MPIDFTAVAARFATAFAAQLARAAVAQKAIEPALARRRTAARGVDLATATFPVVRFHNGAVTMTLAPSQRGVLTRATPDRSFGGHLAAGGLRFLDGLRLAAEPLRAGSQETVIPRFLTSVAAALAEVEASVRRFETPTPRMFDPNARRGSDLFGLAALAWRVLAEASGSSGEVRRLVGQLRATLGVFGVATADPYAPPGPPRPPPLVPPAPEPPDLLARTLPEQLDAAAFELVGAIVLVGSLPQLVAVVLEGVGLRIRDTLLAEFALIEQMVLDLRRTAFETAFVGLTRLADRGVFLVAGTHQVLAANVDLLLGFLRAFGTELALGVRDFVLHFATYLREWTALLETVVVLLAALGGFDLSELLRPHIGFLVALIPAIRIDNLLDPTGTRVNATLRETLNDLVDTAEEKLDSTTADIVGWFTDYVEYGRRQVRRMRWLVSELLPGGPIVTDLPRSAPLRFRSDFPDLSATLFGSGRDAALVAAVDRIGGALRTGVGRALGHTERGLGELADAFTRDTAEAARLGAHGRLARIGPQSTDLAAGVFGPEVAAQRRARDERPEDAIARAFESWLATGGFLLVGEVIDGYVGELARYWRAQLTEGTELTAPLTPTSPHILRRRAVLGRVVMSRLTLRAAPGRVLDEGLADAVAGQFAGAVSEAYRAGQRRLRALAEMGGQ